MWKGIILPQTGCLNNEHNVTLLMKRAKYPTRAYFILISYPLYEGIVLQEICLASYDLTST